MPEHPTTQYGRACRTLELDGYRVIGSDPEVLFMRKGEPGTTSDSSNTVLVPNVPEFSDDIVAYISRKTGIPKRELM